MNSVPVELIEDLARFIPPPVPAPSARHGQRQFDVHKWIERHNLPVSGPVEWNGGNRWVFPVCPWNSEHTNRSAFILQLSNGAISAGCHHNGCSAYRWEDLRRRFEPEFDQRTTGGKVEQAPWEPPVPLLDMRLPTFPVDALPDWPRDYVAGVSESTQTPTDLAGMLSLSVLSAAVARKVEIYVGKGWTEPLNLFTAVALEPGNRKTSVFSAMIGSIEEFERSESQRLEAFIARAENDRRIEENRLKRAQQQAANAKPQERDQLRAVASDLAEAFNEMKVPARPRLIADDCTPEKLGQLLEEQSGRIAILSAEGGVFDILAGRYSSGMANLNVYLCGHAGDTLRVDRIGRPSEYVKKPAVTFGLAVQPAVIRGLADKREFRGRGLLGRFLYSLPESPLGRRNVDPQEVPGVVKAAYRTNVMRLLALPLPQNDDTGLPEVHRLSLSSDSINELREFQRWLEPKLNEFGELGCMSDWAGKLAGVVVRIAGLFHMALHCEEREPWEYPVETRTIESAICLAHYLIPHAKAAFAVMGADDATNAAMRIVRWLEEEGVENFSKRDLHQAIKGSISRVEELDVPLELLAKHGFIRLIEEDAPRGRGRRPSPMFDVNPIWNRRLPRGHARNSENCENSVREPELDEKGRGGNSENFENCEREEEFQEGVE